MNEKEKLINFISSFGNSEQEYEILKLTFIYSVELLNLSFIPEMDIEGVDAA